MCGVSYVPITKTDIAAFSLLGIVTLPLWIVPAVGYAGVKLGSSAVKAVGSAIAKDNTTQNQKRAEARLRTMVMRRLDGAGDSGHASFMIINEDEDGDDTQSALDADTLALRADLTAKVAELEKHPGSSLALLRVGIAMQMHAGDLLAARNYLRRAAESAEKHSEWGVLSLALYASGHLRMTFHDFPEAVECFTRARAALERSGELSASLVPSATPAQPAAPESGGGGGGCICVVVDDGMLLAMSLLSDDGFAAPVTDGTVVASSDTRSCDQAAAKSKFEELSASATDDASTSTTTTTIDRRAIDHALGLAVLNLALYTMGAGMRALGIGDVDFSGGTPTYWHASKEEVDELTRAEALLKSVLDDDDDNNTNNNNANADPTFVLDHAISRYYLLMRSAHNRSDVDEAALKELLEVLLRLSKHNSSLLSRPQLAVANSYAQSILLFFDRLDDARECATAARALDKTVFLHSNAVGINHRMLPGPLKGEELFCVLATHWPLVPTRASSRLKHLAPHKWDKYKFHRPTFCDRCTDFVSWDENQAGCYLCRACGMRVHGSCYEKIRDDVACPAMQNEKSGMVDYGHQHVLREVTLRSPSWCSHCRKYCWKLGAFKCEVCQSVFHTDCAPKVGNAVVVKK